MNKRVAKKIIRTRCGVSHDKLDHQLLTKVRAMRKLGINWTMTDPKTGVILLFRYGSPQPFGRI